MATRLTLAIMEKSRADLLYGLLERKLYPAMLGKQLQLTKRNNIYMDIECLTHSGKMKKNGLFREMIQLTAEAVAEYIVEHEETRLLTRMIARQFEHQEEIGEVLHYCQVMLSGATDDSIDPPLQSTRKSEIARKVYVYLAEHQRMDVQGFLQFRLPAYRSDLKETVDYAMDEYVSNRQYQEFISLLKYFVYFQEAKIPEVHLIHCGGNKYMMLDHRLRPIELSRSEEMVIETIDKELNYEDMIVSTLISASPNHVTIHTREPDTLSIRTIRQIFEGRTTLCMDCSCCKPVLDVFIT